MKKGRPLYEQTEQDDAPTGISASISFQHPFNRAGGRTSNVLQEMKTIPTKPVWYLIGRTGGGDVKSFDRFWTASEAESALTEKANALDGLDYSVDESESIIPDRTLPTRAQQIALGGFLQRAFVVLRYISYGRENFEAIEQLTDILHNFPREMFDPDQWDWNSYIYALRKFEEKFGDVQTANLAAMLEEIKEAEQGRDGDAEEAV
jgi:hypothetical protein